MALDQQNMKRRVAGTLKWNTIDKLGTQLLYAVSGIILARVLSQEDFGLVGAILVFQAFASIFVDSGFGYALLQRKEPDRLDYSTVLWFNLGISLVIYIILYFAAPLIAWCFGNDQRLIPLSRVMFLSFVISATGIVQTNVLMKRMDVKMIAISNAIAMVLSASVGIWLALTGCGAWAIVWQTITLATVKSAVLWAAGNWRPLWQFSWSALKSFMRVGMGALSCSLLNTISQSIYSFFIGNRTGLVSLGYYTQADKWSKMGITSLSQILTQSFLPALSHYQDDPQQFASAVSKMNRLSAYLLFPAVGMLLVMSQPIFHVLFGTKWDPSVILFQLLLVRGIFTVLNQVYHYYLLARGLSGMMVKMEVLRDALAIGAIFITLPYIAISLPDAITRGVEIFLMGQLAASAISWVVMLIITSRHTWRTPWQYICDMLPYIALTALAMAAMWLLGRAIENDWLLLGSQAIMGIALYVGINAVLHSKIQHDIISYLLHK